MELKILVQISRRVPATVASDNLWIIKQKRALMLPIIFNMVAGVGFEPTTFWL